jgi:acyl-[acyl-carrier-protein]-phospholipid O-acyltransferase/long-chain-fatty-acid--[acyl-carrier-protein] ligase
VNEIEAKPAAGTQSPQTEDTAAAANGAGRGFWALIVTQFQGAFSDNTLRWLTTYMIMQMGLDLATRDRLIAIVSALFTVPFILFSMTGGFLADRFSKRSVVLGVKVSELFVMSLALCSLALHWLYLTISCVFLMAVHSAIFGPSKYGLLPELLPEKKLSWGNGVLEFGTFIAIIGGTVLGGVLSKIFAAQPAWSGVLLIALALVGFGTGLAITKVPAAAPTKPYRLNFVGDLWAQLKIIRSDRPLWLALIGNTYFFGIAALIQLVIVIYASDVMGIEDPLRTSELQAATAIGIGLGCFLAGFLSAGKIETGLIPLGALGLTVCAALMGRHGLSFGGAAVNLSVLGFFGGFYIVPISAMLQHRPRRDQKGGVLAAANLISFVGIGVGTVLFFVLSTPVHVVIPHILFHGISLGPISFWLLPGPHKLSPPEIFLVIAALTLAATVYLLTLLPEALLRFALWCITNTIYRIRVVGRDNIPAKGGALFVCNHLSFADALLLIASTDRPIRFLMFKDIYDRPRIRPFAKILRAIPISSEQRPRELLQSLHTASEAIRAGEVVCIFAEGQITRIGQLLPFQRGFERIMKGLDAPIIPVALDGVLGSPTSFQRGQMVRWFPEHLPHRVTVSFGAAMPSTATHIEVREAVQGLIADAWQYRRARMKPMPHNLVRSARRHPRRFFMSDATSGSVTFGTALAKTVFLARRLKRVWHGQEMVGLFLPPTVPGALVNYAALLCGKVPVNLNYTLSEATIGACARQCNIQTVITSRTFLEKIKLTPPGKIIYLEDVAAAPSLTEKLAAWLLSKFAPYAMLRRAAGVEKEVALDDIATVIFSSGSTGEPKGVMLTHYNILSNLDQFSHILSFTHHDRLLGILPFFHSFGFTVTLCMPPEVGAGVVYHPNPLDARAIGSLVRQHKVTILLSTPTFLQIYMRSIPSGDFGSLQLIIVGAEKLSERLADAAEQYFGIRPMEGYGTTECAPAVAVNIMDFRAAGFHQIGGKRGKIGRVLPGMVARLAPPDDPWNGGSVPPGEPGMLLVRGPNVMRGYLGLPEKTADVLRHGWYCTGDVATVDEDGFLQITGRLSRFSKIGGEMVPHLKIEEKLQELAGVAETMFVVSSAPDEKKGERIVVLHRLGDTDLAACLEKLTACDLPNLWKPKADAFHRVEQFPLLGTGKLDLRAVKELAAKLAS